METRIFEIVKPGEPIGHEQLSRLRQLWTETYLGFMLITSRSDDPSLRLMKDKLTEANEAVITFIDEWEKRLRRT